MPDDVVEGEVVEGEHQPPWPQEEVHAEAAQDQGKPVEGAVVNFDDDYSIQSLSPEVVEALPEESKAKMAYTLHNQIVNDGNEAMSRFIRMGRNFFTVRKFGLFKALGFDTFDSWRAQPDIKVSKATAAALMKVYEVYIDRLQVPVERIAQLDWTKLYTATGVANKDNIENLLVKIETLSRNDLNRDLAAYKSPTARRIKGDIIESQKREKRVDAMRALCPIGCGNACPVIQKDEDAALADFDKWLGKWKFMIGLIKGLTRRAVSRARRSKAKAPQDAETDQ